MPFIDPNYLSSQINECDSNCGNEMIWTPLCPFIPAGYRFHQIAVSSEDHLWMLIVVIAKFQIPSQGFSIDKQRALHELHEVRGNRGLSIHIYFGRSPPAHGMHQRD